MTRLLPCMDINDYDPEARGYIKESFYKGMSGAGLFFSHQAGREGLLNTSIQTAKYGEMHRRMVRGYCNVVLDNDYSLRMGDQKLLSPVFNLGSSIESNVGVSVGGERITSLIDLHQIALDLNGEAGWIKSEASAVIEAHSKNRSGDDVRSLQRKFRSPLPVEQYDDGTGLLPDKITSFEKATLVGYRAEQLQHGYPVLFSEGSGPGKEERWDGVDPVAAAIRETQLSLFNMQVKRVLPNGQIVEVDPSTNLAFAYRYPVEDWMEEESKVHYNRTFPTLIEDIPDSKPKAHVKRTPQLSADLVNRISEFAETEGMAVEDTREAEMAHIVAAVEEDTEGSAACTRPRTSAKKGTRRPGSPTTQAPPARKQRPSSPTRGNAAIVRQSGSANPDYATKVVETVTPLKSSFIDAETFYGTAPDESPANRIPTVLKVRKANNMGKRSLIYMAKSQFEEKVSVMDVCCGRGGDLAKWGTGTSELYGVDISSAMLNTMQERWDNNRERYPSQLRLCRMDVREPQPPESLSKFDIVSCMFGLNYMDEGKGELTTCLQNMCKATHDTSAVILVYANHTAVRTFQSTADCSVTPASAVDWSRGYNFRLGSLVDAMEYEVDSAVIDSTMAAGGFMLVLREAMLPFLGKAMNWSDKNTGDVVADAMRICNMYVVEMWIKK